MVYEIPVIQNWSKPCESLELDGPNEKGIVVLSVTDFDHGASVELDKASRRRLAEVLAEIAALDDNLNP